MSSIFNFSDHAAAVVKDMREPRTPSIRDLPGVSLRLEVTDLIRVTGTNPEKVKQIGEYVSTGFAFVLREATRLPESTDEQFAAAEVLVGKPVAMIYNLKGDPSRAAFGLANQRNLQDILTIGYCLLVNKILHTPTENGGGPEAARSFKHPGFASSYPTEAARQKALQQVHGAIEDAFSGDEGLFVGTQIVCDNSKGRQKTIKGTDTPIPGEFWYNPRFRAIAS